MTDMEAKAEQLMKELSTYLDTKDKNPDAPLFHYTNFNGLCGILQSRQIWLTDHKYLNDPSEIQHGKNLILKFIFNHIKKNIDLSARLQYFINEVIEKGYKTYLTAFCKGGDYLPAWRYYGDNGAGFSIGFKKEYFTRSADVTKRDAMLLYEIEYKNSEFEQINDMFNIANTIFPNWQESDALTLQPYVSALITNLISILPCIKNEDYKDEKEWRLCMIRIFYAKTNEWFPAELPMERLIINKIEHPRIPPFAKDVKTTIPRLKSLKFGYCNIDTIYIGPRLDFLTAKLAIEKILIDGGISETELKSISIKASERPYK